MNLRILKKLSKRAAPYLPLLGDGREQFPAERGENYHGLLIMDRTCWERGRSVHGDLIGEHEIKRPAADGKGWVYMHPPSCPLKGTMMIGGVSGYYEPEWDEECCYGALDALVRDHFTDWEALMAEDDHPAAQRPVLLRDLSTPSKVFRAADEMVAARRRGASA